MLTPDGTLLEANETSLRFIDACPSDVVGKRFWDTPWWGHDANLQSNLRAAVKRAASGSVVRFEATHTKPGGEQRPVDFSLKPVFEDEAAVGYLISECRDITDIRRARQERDRIFNLSPDLLCIGKMDGYFKRVNPAFHKVLGYSETEILKRPFLDFIHNDDRRNAVSKFKRLSTGSGTVDLECRFRRKDGSYLWISWTAVTIVPDGELYAVGRDTTQRRKMLEEINERAERIRAIVETAPDAIVTIGERGDIRHFNPAAEKIFGHHVEEVRGRNVSLLMPEPHHSRHDGYLRHYLQEGHSRIVSHRPEVRGQRKDGSTFPLEISISVVNLGKRKMFTAVLRDITKRKRTEAALQRTQRGGRKGQPLQKQISGQYEP